MRGWNTLKRRIKMNFKKIEHEYGCYLSSEKDAIKDRNGLLDCKKRSKRLTMISGSRLLRMTSLLSANF